MEEIIKVGNGILEQIKQTNIIVVTDENLREIYSLLNN